MKVKICGITHPDDAVHAAHSGADFIGMLFSDFSKRRVSIDLAKDIVNAILQTSAIPVGVFVNETADEIISICEQTQISIVQLHGSISKSAVYELPKSYSIYYAVPVMRNGKVLEEISLPAGTIPIYDYYKGSSEVGSGTVSGGGSGQSFDWTGFSPPQDQWILAGGLTPDNLKEALSILNPYGVDVCSGVEAQNSVRKDPSRVNDFIISAKQRSLK